MRSDHLFCGALGGGAIAQRQLGFDAHDDRFDRERAVRPTLQVGIYLSERLARSARCKRLPRAIERFYFFRNRRGR